MKPMHFVLIILTTLLLIGCTEKKAEPVPVGQMQEYRDPGYGFKIQYPADWKQLGQIGKAIFAKSEDVTLRFQDFKSGLPGGMATVTVLELKGHNPADVIGSANDELKTYAQVKPEQQVTVAGKQVTKYPYSFQATKKISVDGYVVYIPGDTAVYAVDFKAYGTDQFEAHQAVFTAMLNSFQLPVVAAKKSDVWQPKAPTDYTSAFFTMQYPEDMNFAPVKKGDKDLVVELRAPDRQDCSIHIDVFGAKNLNIDKVWDQNKGRYKARGNGKTTIDGQPAYWVDYAGGKDVSSRAYFAVKNDKVIRITLNWFTPQKDVYFPALENVVKSIKLK